MTNRLPMLDVLRAAAIILVLFRHLPSEVLDNGALRAMFRGGWIGVDIFFVISGFLIGGILFKEYQQTSGINITRFYVRRGFKIWPSFYFLLAGTAVYNACTGHANAPLRYAVEGAFLSNYLPQYLLYFHTWSLCVEEHFYIVLPLVLAGMRAITKSFVFVVPAFCAVAVVCIAMRFWAYLEYGNWQAVVFRTHLRVDSLMMGVLLSYWNCYSHERFQKFITRWQGWLLGMGCLCLLPAFVYELGFMQSVFGVSLYYCGSAMIVCWAIAACPDIHDGGLAGQIGQYSYNIYLWHIPALHWIVVPLMAALGHRVSALTIVAYFATSILLGALLSHLIEFPALCWRERMSVSKDRISLATRS